MSFFIAGFFIGFIAGAAVVTPRPLQAERTLNSAKLVRELKRQRWVGRFQPSYVKRKDEV